MKADWDFSGFVTLARFTLDVARDAANADGCRPGMPGTNSVRRETSTG